ncbi:unnamed protein product [Blepharisma stoltei]|uniref:Protein phosphatase methylesterase 1 n=1 Tax=Blepharisma stoltei TaxID=1481888 RepID=A0AAU9JW88_9CILI|nr:unnamed protein product [Blepharisma stoltei]
MRGRPPVAPTQHFDLPEEDEEAQDTVTPIGHAHAHLRRNMDCTPLDWRQYFDELIWFGPIPIYKAGTSGPVFLALHGAGLCSFGYACAAKLLKSDCRFFAFDFRAHGHNQLSESEYQLDVDTLINETLSVMDYIRSITDNHQIILVGHSMGGAIASKAALEDHKRGKGVMGLIVLDVVEGSAIDALPHMDNIISQRPRTFQSLEQAIQWAVNSNTVKNIESARISMPAQVVEENGIWRWRTDLAMTRQYWEGWFRGMNNAFLGVVGPKQLMIAGSDRTDRQMMIAQMQGKFKHTVLFGVGHTVHEDAPEQFAEQVRIFISTFKLK